MFQPNIVYPGDIEPTEVPESTEVRLPDQL
jgi:hypothetical protein